MLQDDDRTAVAPATFAGGALDRYRHVCAFVNGQAVDERVLDAFVRQGVDQGGGGFDQTAMLDLLDRMLVARPAPRIRMVADMGWAIGREDDADRLIEFEARANFIHGRHEHVVICSYDTARFDGTFILDILRTHPLVYLGGMLQQNPFFLAPPQFLAERAGRTTRWP
ncbi:MEDS domain-containing protein [Leifsonia shinshuensis]|uniref:MEDS domain-containing protein n=1 Tax=Leifsonia shinshuensis TaxID=150026 RepID=UPI001F5089BD|nr:MEDS domain-containing protein [Leifsonia shinshuensis]MCI0157059.1 MEDS domain-containing protein [Leifsonia shinshuensis]